MIETGRLIKASVLWMSITYVICYVGVAMFPDLRSTFMLYALHSNVETGKNVFSITNFVIGLIWWDVLTAGGVWLFAELWNRIRG